jgi:TRAP-type mannitol/chloroaromatic compound transport system permease small subunit
MNQEDRAASGGLLGLLDRMLIRVEFVTAVFAGIVIFFVMWVGVCEIFSRKLFNYPLYGQLDLIEQSMSSYALLTISYCWRQAGHIRVEILAQRFEGRTKWVVEMLTTLAALVLITAIWPGVLHFFQNAWEIGDSTINTRWPTWPSKAVPVVGLAILWARLLLEIVAFLRLIADPTATPVAVPQRHSPVDEAVHESEQVSLGDADTQR